MNWKRLQLAQGAIDRRRFWSFWPLTTLPWIGMWAHPVTMFGWWALLIALPPTIYLFTLRMHDAGFRSRWLLAVWMLLAWLSFDAAAAHTGSLILAMISGWRHGGQLWDIGPEDALWKLAGATLAFLLLSLAVGYAPPRAVAAA